MNTLQKLVIGVAGTLIGEANVEAKTAAYL